MRNISSIILVILLGFSLLWVGTDGFRAYTAEKARFIKFEKEQPSLPPVTFQDAIGSDFQLTDLKNKYVLATFMYTNCGDVCPIVEMNMANIYTTLPAHVRGKEIVFLSISFDPKRDTPEKLEMYGHHFGADGVSWRMVTVPNEEQLTNLLETVGVVVIPNETGGFEHNSAFYLMNDKGKLMKIFDYQSINSVVDYLATLY